MDEHHIPLRAVKIILWLAPIVLFVWLVDKHLVLGGTLKIVYHPNQPSLLVRNFASKEPDKLIGTKNISGNIDYFQLITTNPTYFDVKVPRPFKSANVILTYQNPNGQPVTRLGAKLPSGAYHLENMAFQNATLDNLPDYWDKISQGDIVLWQKDNARYRETLEKKKAFPVQKKKLDDARTQTLVNIEKNYGPSVNLNSERMQAMLTEQQIVEARYQDTLEKITEESVPTIRSKPLYSTIEEFTSNIPAISKIAEYNYNVAKYIHLPGYQPSGQETIINKSIRGAHEIDTYIGKNENLNFLFNIQDSNRHDGPDVFSVSIEDSGGVAVGEEKLPDDGDTQASSIVTQERSLKVFRENLPEGVYKIKINAPDDIFIKNISTAQHLIVFKGNIYLTDSKAYKDILGEKVLTPTTVYTTSTKISAQTSHPESLQTLKVGRLDLRLTAINSPAQINNLTGVTAIVSPGNDVYIQGDGFFALDKSQIFNQDYASVAQVDSVEHIDDYDYIIADYPQPRTEGDWLVADATIEPQYLYLDKGKDILAHFIIDFPGLPEHNRTMKIKELTITFHKDPITIKNFFPKLSSWLTRQLRK